MKAKHHIILKIIYVDLGLCVRYNQTMCKENLKKISTIQSLDGCLLPLYLIQVCNHKDYS